VEVARGIHRLSLGVANWYLVEEGGRAILVDAGAPGDWSLLLSTLADRGLPMSALEAVLLTHAHSDHTGFAERARAEGGAKVWIHQADAACAKGARPPKNDGGMLRHLLHLETWRSAISLMRRGGTKIVPIVEVSEFADGEVLDAPGRPRAIHAPGHTPGHSALLFDDRSALLCGDAVVTHNPLTGRVGPQIMPSAFNRDTPEALRSLAVLENVQADVMLPGHGDPFTGGLAEAVRLARAAGVS
jgi:glyoxylase-like metal-dependent hydrolase (beta-lactamase superfamily II)